MNDEENKFVIGLKEGDCVVVYNRRVMHGRESFRLREGEEGRSIVGCYTGADELESRWRCLFTK